MTNLNQRWDLDSIFPGGSSSPELQEQLNSVRSQIAALKAKVEALGSELDAEQLRELVHEMQNVQAGFGECRAFVACLTAQNVRDNQAKLLQRILARSALLCRSIYLY